MLTAGIDIGSISTKAAVLADGRLLGSRVIFTGYNSEAAGKKVFEELLEELGLLASAVGRIVSTGYGRSSVKFVDKAVTEIICHGTGAHFLNPLIRSVIDIGGQDSKAIVLDENGKVKNFAMNDKCAAGTGRFLEMLARKLDLAFPAFIEAALQSTVQIHMNSTCAVFAESEVVSLLARNVAKADIAAAAHQAIADRIGSMVRRVGQRDVIAFVGGGALNRALARTLEESLNKKVYIPESPQTIVALGAAIAACRTDIKRGL